MADDRRGKTRPGLSYKDPIYDAYDAEFAKKYDLPAGGARGVRTLGEKSNADQVSPVGARTVYQIMPDTRARFLKTYGIDAYAGPREAAEVSALHLRDDYRKTGSWETAITRYIGGPDPSKHGPVTAAYTARVTGRPAPASDGGHRAPALARLSELSISDILNTAPADLGDTRRPLGPQRRDPAMTPQARRERHLSALTDGRGVVTGPQSDTSIDLSAEEQNAADAVNAETFRKRYTAFQRFGAAVDQLWMSSALARAWDDANEAVDPQWQATYTKNWQALEEDAESQAEVDERREANSHEEYSAIVARQGHNREMRQAINGSPHSTALTIGTSLIDPLGWVAGGAIGKGFQVAGAGSRVLMQSGRTGAAVAALATEGAVGNLAFTGALDMSGEHTTPEDYGISALTGLGIGMALSPFVLRGYSGMAEAKNLKLLRQQAEAAKEARFDVAKKALGPDATPEAIKSHVQRQAEREQLAEIQASLADIPAELRLLHNDPDFLMTSDPKLKADVEARHNLTSMADDAERELVGEHIARSEAILEVNPIDTKALKTVLATAGMESTGLRLLNSESPVAKAVGVVLLEGTTGAAGRRRTAAMSQAVRERLYNRHMLGYDSLYHQFRKSEGVGIMSEVFSGRVRKQFNGRVFDEIEARGGAPDTYKPDTHPAVVAAADQWERGMTAMRLEQQHVNTVGSVRLGDNSRGYISHKIDIRMLNKLTPKQEARVREILSAQFVDPRNGFDKAFSDKLAVKYLDDAKNRGHGAYDVPMNLHSAEAADIVRDSLSAMNLGPDEVEKLMGKFSRGGATHTKRRLRLDLSEDIGDGMKLRDLFDTDITALYRGYARRTSGEVALAQYGIMGKKGLNVLRKAISSSGGSVDDLISFDQIAAEFLNTPFGDYQHRYMDNLRLATSLARLGGMGITQFGEFTNGIAVVGVHGAFSAIAALPRMVREVTHLKNGGEAANPILQSIDTLGGYIGLDDYHNTRLFDIKDNDIQLYGTESLGVGSRALRAGSNIHAMLSGQRMMTAAQTRLFAEQIIHKAVAMVRRGGDDIALDDMGINADLRAALARNLDKIATFKGDKLASLDIRAGDLTPHETNSLRDAIERGSSQIIQRTYTGETGKWAHNGLLRLLTQFSTFSITAAEKQWARNRANYGALKAAMYLGAAMSFAIPIHIARVQLKTAGMSRKEREKYADDHLTPLALARASMNYAAASGLLGDIMDVGGGFASSYGGDTGEAIQKALGGRSDSGGKLFGGVIAPGMGLAEDLWAGAHGNGEKLLKAMPFANLPYTAPLVNLVTQD